MAVQFQSVAITTDALGAGTATFARPINGEVYEIRVNAQQFSSTADYAVTRTEPFGGTIAYIANNNGPFQVSPGIPVYDDSGNKSLYGSSAGGTVVRRPLCPGYAKVTVAQGGSAQSGTVFILYNGD